MRSEYYECEAAKDQEKYHSPYLCTEIAHKAACDNAQKCPILVLQNCGYANCSTHKNE